MHQTTVRFGADLWQELEAEAARLGVSSAQFVRDAALARLSYDAGRRDEPGGEPASGGEPTRGRPGRGKANVHTPTGAPRGDAPPAGDAADIDPAAAALERSRSELSDSDALWAQGRLARTRATQLRDDVHRLRSRIATNKR